MKATPFSSSISANLGNSGEAMVEIHKYSERNLWPPQFRTFCELVEGEENKLTTFSTWTIMLGCNDHFPAASLQTWATPEKRSSNEEETNWPHSMA